MRLQLKIINQMDSAREYQVSDDLILRSLNVHLHNHVIIKREESRKPTRKIDGRNPVLGLLEVMCVNVNCGRTTVQNVVNGPFEFQLSVRDPPEKFKK